MKAVISVCVVLLVASLVLVKQDGAQVGTDENRILTLESAWSQAEQHQDVKVLDELLSNTLIYVEYDGTLMGKKDYLASRQSSSLHPAQVTNESTTVHMYNNLAIVNGVYREKGTNNGKSYERRGRFTDTWISQNGVWQCVASQSTLVAAK